MTRYSVRQTYPIWTSSFFNEPTFNEAFNWLFDRPQATNNDSGKNFYSPRLNVIEDEGNYYVYLMLPGINPEKLDITTLGNKLAIQGESELPAFGPQTPAEGEKATYRWLHRELPANGLSFKRELELPFAVEPEQVQASYENGVLKLLLPKAASAKPRKIALQGASQLVEAK
jgi:HSP20 family protein